MDEILHLDPGRNGAAFRVQVDPEWGDFFLRNAKYVEEKVLHQFYDGENPKVLCIKDVPPPYIWIPDLLKTTEVNADVTCTECLEWIHA